MQIFIVYIYVGCFFFVCLFVTLMGWALVHMAEEHFFLFFNFIIVMVMVVASVLLHSHALQWAYKLVIIVAPQNGCYRFTLNSCPSFFQQIENTLSWSGTWMHVWVWIFDSFSDGFCRNQSLLSRIAFYSTL